MPLENFVILTKNSHTGIGCFPEVPWHKQEREHILRQLGIRVEHGEEIKEAVDKGAFLTVSDTEHTQIIVKYASGFSMQRVADALSRSTATVKRHVHKHDDAVGRSGFCPLCKRVGGEKTKTQVLRHVAKN